MKVIFIALCIVSTTLAQYEQFPNFKIETKSRAYNPAPVPEMKPATSYGYNYNPPTPAPEKKVLAPAYSAPSLPSYGTYAADVKTVKEMIPIVKYVASSDNYGTYNFETEGGDGSSAQEQGTLKDVGGTDGPVVVKSGSYKYIGPDGKTYQVNYIADELGFRVVGDHIPQAEPLQ